MKSLKMLLSEKLNYYRNLLRQLYDKENKMEGSLHVSTAHNNYQYYWFKEDEKMA